MTTLWRILKYTPAVVTGLLFVAWVTSVYYAIGFVSTNPATSDLGTAVMERGDIFVRLDNRLFSSVKFVIENPRLYEKGPRRQEEIFGTLLFVDNGDGGPWQHIQTNLGRYAVRIPFLLLITAMLPLAIGPFISYRFRLWHYFAFIAILSLELAYYLQWQSWTPKPTSDDPFAGRIKMINSDRG